MYKYHRIVYMPRFGTLHAMAVLCHHVECLAFWLQQARWIDGNQNVKHATPKSQREMARTCKVVKHKH